MLHSRHQPGRGLRQWCEKTFGRPAVEKVWGFQEGDKGHASFVTVDDLYVGDAQLIPEVRDGVGIDRYTVAAAKHIKYDRAILSLYRAVGLHPDGGNARRG